MASVGRFFRSTKINLHGIFGFIAIIFMIVIAIHQNWNITWWYFIASIVLYSSIIIYLTISLEKSIGEEHTRTLRELIGCHIAFLFLVAGFWLNFTNLFVQLGIFVTAIFAGLTIPFIVFSATKRTPHVEYRERILVFNKLGLLGLIPLAFIIGVAFYLHWNIIWWYFILGILSYSIAITWFNIDIEIARYGPTLTQYRWSIGCHLALMLIAASLLFHFTNFFIQVAVFLVSVAVGMALPFLLIRDS